MTLDERNEKRNAIMDEDLARMDRIKAERGEGREFFLAMQFATERLRAFDTRHPIHSCTR